MINLPINNGVIVMTPDLETIMVARGYVTQYMNLLSSVFCPLQLIDKPLKFLGWVS